METLRPLGDLLGWLDGSDEGTPLGIDDGYLLGWLDGSDEGTSLGIDDGDLLGASVEQKAFSKGKGIEEEQPLPLPLPLPPFPLLPPLPVVGRGLEEGAADGTSLKPTQLLSRAAQLQFAMAQAS